MPNFNSDMLSISEFSALSGIDRNTLIYYDRIGLFKPRHVKENSYRYYGYEQMEDIYLIVTLKAAGMSIQAIEDYVQDRSPEKYYEMLKTQRAELDRQIAALQQRRAMLHQRTLAYEDSKEHFSAGVQLLHQDPVLLYSGPRLTMDKARITDAVFTDFVRDFQRVGIISGFMYNLSVSKESLQAKKPQILDCFYLCVDDLRYANSVAPGGTYAVTWEYGYYGQVDRAWERIYAYLEENRLTIAGNGYEEAVSDEISRRELDALLFRVSVPVSKGK